VLSRRTRLQLPGTVSGLPSHENKVRLSELILSVHQANILHCAAVSEALPMLAVQLLDPVQSHMRTTVAGLL
jgi:hypothetical protein